MATLSAQCRTATDRGRTSLLPLLRLLLVALVLVPKLMPIPSALEGQPAPSPDATPCRSSHTSALGDLQTMYTMLGEQLSRTVQQITNAQKFPARKFPALQSTDMHARSRTDANCRPEPPSLYDGTSPLHSKHRMPIRHPYTTNRPQVTQSSQSNQRQSHTWSSPRFTVLNSMDTTQSMFQLVFPVCNARMCRYTDSSHKIQCTAATRKTAMNAQRPTATMQRTHTNELVHTFPTNKAFVPSG